MQTTNICRSCTHAAGNNSTKQHHGNAAAAQGELYISSFSAANQAILTAMKNYGMIVADNGSNMYSRALPTSRWDDNDLDALKAIDASNFDVVQIGTNTIMPLLPPAPCPPSAASRPRKPG